MDIRVREATPADADEIAAVCASAVATLRESHRPNRKTLAQKQAVGETLTRFVAVLNGRVIGAVEYGGRRQTSVTDPRSSSHSKTTF
jgi:hypothetical protein